MYVFLFYFVFNGHHGKVVNLYSMSSTSVKVPLANPFFLFAQYMLVPGKDVSEMYKQN